MYTVKCSNRNCEKEYNAQFDNCPFCGKSNPMEESERIILAEKERTMGKNNNLEEDHPFNILVIGIIWMSIIFGGIRGFVNCLTYFDISPLAGSLAIGLHAFSIVVLCFILAAKKWAIYAWLGYVLAVVFFNGYFDNDYLPYVSVGALKLLFLFLVLQIKKNGISAWSIIISKNNISRKNKTIRNNTVQSYYGVENSIHESGKNKEELSESPVDCSASDMRDTDTITNNESIKIEVQQLSSKAEKTIQTYGAARMEPNTTHKVDEEERHNSQKNELRRKLAFWSIVLVLLAILVVGIWKREFKKTSKNNSLTERYDSQLNKGNQFQEAYNSIRADKKRGKSIWANSNNQKVHDEMVNMARLCNQDLPESLGYGMTMMRCAIENRSIVYTIQWKGVCHADLSAEDVADMKYALIEGLIEEEQESIGSRELLNTMSKYDYMFVYRYVNEYGEEICSISVLPSEI